MRIIKATAILLLLFCVFGQAAAQEILTPSRYFEQISIRFGDIEDYRAEISIDQNEGEIVMEGTLYYKKPDKLRIDFTEPRDQVLAMDGEKLQIYIPEYSYILEQTLKRKGEAGIAAMASEQQLTYLSENYSVAYLIGPEPVPLEEESEGGESDEMVIKLKFESHSTAEGFRQLEIAFSEDGLIRRVMGKTLKGSLVMDFEDIAVNINIPEAIFEYNAPPNANAFPNFLYEGIE